MSGYAVRNDQQGQRAVNSAADCGVDEYFSAVPITIIPFVTATDVQIECDNRILTKFYFNSVHHSTRDMMDINQMAFMAIAGGALAGDYRWADDTTDFTRNDFDGNPITMDAPTVVAMARAALSFSQKMYAKARSLKALSPIPLNYKDDSYWE